MTARITMAALHQHLQMKAQVCLVFFVLALSATCRASAADQAFRDAEKLVDQLQDISSAAPGIDPSRPVKSFIATGMLKPPWFLQRAYDSDTVPTAMVDLVRLGWAAIPVLIAHLGDARATQLTVGHSWSIDDAHDEGFYLEFFSDEYEPRNHGTAKERSGRLPLSALEEFKGSYRIKVGDVCFFLLGHIVNRSFAPVHIQSYRILVVASPVVRPKLAAEVRTDWLGITEDELLQSFVLDVEGAKREVDLWDAATRLRYYYPSAYELLAKTTLRAPLARFEKLQSYAEGERELGSSQETVSHF